MRNRSSAREPTSGLHSNLCWRICLHVWVRQLLVEWKRYQICICMNLALIMTLPDNSLKYWTDTNSKTSASAERHETHLDQSAKEATFAALVSFQADTQCSQNECQRWNSFCRICTVASAQAISKETGMRLHRWYARYLRTANTEKKTFFRLSKTSTCSVPTLWCTRHMRECLFLCRSQQQVSAFLYRSRSISVTRFSPVLCIRRARVVYTPRKGCVCLSLPPLSQHTCWHTQRRRPKRFDSFLTKDSKVEEDWMNLVTEDTRW